MAKKNGIHTAIMVIAVVTVAALAAYDLWGGGKERDILGCWVTESSGMKSGFQCGRQGIAASIYNSTHQYNRWTLSKNNLILTGKSFEDGQVTDFCDTLHIKKLSAKAMTVESGGVTLQYIKKM